MGKKDDGVTICIESAAALKEAKEKLLGSLLLSARSKGNNALLPEMAQIHGDSASEIISIILEHDPDADPDQLANKIRSSLSSTAKKT